MSALPPSLVASLGTVATVTLSGPDARRFANGMFTNNVRDLAPGSSHRTGLTDDRGRLWALAELHALADDRFRLHLDGRTAAEFEERYETYIVFDDVTIEATSTPGVTVQGLQAAQVLAAAGLPVPSLGAHLAHEACLVVGRDRSGSGTGFDVWGASSLEVVAEADQLTALEIRAGQVRMADVVPPGLPHEHGLRDAILHFEKGCYLGQESIHRIDVMGNPRRALAVVAADGLTSGPLEAEGRVQGKVTRVAGGVGLAVLRKPFDVVGTRLDQQGRPVEVISPRRPHA